MDPDYVRLPDRMRLAFLEETRATWCIHLVNRHLVRAFTNDRMWTDGLLAFYEVFRFLEEAVKRSESLVKSMYNPVLVRTIAFEKDLDYYLREDWRTNPKRNPATVRFIDHLQDLERNDPIMLLAYIYYLNQGLVAGAELLKKERKELNEDVSYAVATNNGTALIYYRNIPLQNIRRIMAGTIHMLSFSMDEDTQIRLIEECKTVFLYSREIIENIHRPKSGLLKNIILVGAGAGLLGLGISLLFSCIISSSDLK